MHLREDRSRRCCVLLVLVYDIEVRTSTKQISPLGGENSGLFGSICSQEEAMRCDRAYRWGWKLW